MNTITKRLYQINKTRLLSTRIYAELPDSACHRKRPPPVKAAVSYDDSMRSLGDPGPLSTICFVYNINSHPITISEVHNTNSSDRYTTPPPPPPAQRKHTINSLNSNNSRNYINPPEYTYMNTITMRLYQINKTRLLSTRIYAELPDSACHRKRPPPVKAAVSYDDSMRSLGDPGPLSTISFVYNINSHPITISEVHNTNSSDRYTTPPPPPAQRAKNKERSGETSH